MICRARVGGRRGEMVGFMIPLDLYYSFCACVYIQAIPAPAMAVSLSAVLKRIYKANETLPLCNRERQKSMALATVLSISIAIMLVSAANSSRSNSRVAKR